MAQEWYVRFPDRIGGPFSPSDLRRMARDGQLTPDLAVSPDRKRWARASKLKGVSFPENPNEKQSKPTTAPLRVEPAPKLASPAAQKPPEFDSHRHKQTTALLPNRLIGRIRWVAGFGIAAVFAIGVAYYAWPQIRSGKPVVILDVAPERKKQDFSALHAASGSSPDEQRRQQPLPAREAAPELRKPLVAKIPNTEKDEKNREPLAVDQGPTQTSLGKTENATLDDVTNEPDPPMAVEPLPLERSEVDPAVDYYLKVSSRKYLDYGFNEIFFGTTRREIESQVVRLSPDRHNPRWLVDNRGKAFLFDSGELHAFSKGYEGNNEAYLDELIKIFGRTSKENIIESRWTGGGDGYLLHDIYFFFPFVIVNVKATVQTDLRTGAKRSEKLWLNLYDREWVLKILSRSAREKREFLEWIVKYVVNPVDDDTLDLETMEAFRNAKREFSPLGQECEFKASSTRRKAIWWGRRFFSEGSEAIAFSLEGETFFVMEKIIEDKYPPYQVDESGSTKIWMNLRALPITSECPLHGSNLEPQLISINSGILQSALPPKGTTITVKKSPESAVKSYEWTTKNGWKVSVGNSGHVQLTKGPKVDL